MNKRFTALVAALSMVGAAVLSTLGVSPAGAVAEGVIDVAVTIDPVTDVVSPPGAYGLYAIQGTNPGVVAVADAVVTVTLPTGSVYDDAISTPACDRVSDTVVTCSTGPMAAGSEGPTFEIAASTPASAGVYEVVAHIQENDPVYFEPLEYTGNNSATQTISVVAPNGPGSYGLVKGGDSISYSHADGRQYVLTVPASSPGVIVSIEPNDGTGYSCGTSPCGKGFHTDFVDHPYFHAKDKTDPIFTKKTFGGKEPCNGLGNASCNEIYFAKELADPALSSTALTKMPACFPAGTAEPDPCLARIYKVNGLPWFDVLMTSDDPLEVPPLLLGR